MMTVDMTMNSTEHKPRHVDPRLNLSKNGQEELVSDYTECH